jgi:anti-sigma B factor antagonist
MTALETSCIRATYDRSGPDLSIRLSGELDSSVAVSFAQDVIARIDADLRTVTIDVSDLGFCDSYGLRAFVDVRNHLLDNHAELVLFRPRPVLCRLLEVTGIDCVVTIRS